MCDQCACGEIHELDPFDSEGNILNEGDQVKILHIPEWVYGGLRQDSVEAIRACEGETMIIDEIDEHGYVWVQKIAENDNGSKRVHSFSNEPQNFLKIRQNS
ncbi:MAG: hypothetical protein OEY94_09540 [Alphaproteobacteria bacterium]|nr:hypothetical protein [Alphaproteobacteria bacterium]